MSAKLKAIALLALPFLVVAHLEGIYEQAIAFGWHRELAAIFALVLSGVAFAGAGVLWIGDGK